jgi:hypothetical protein
VFPNALCHYRKINNPKNTGGGGKGNPFRLAEQTLADGSEQIAAIVFGSGARLLRRRGRSATKPNANEITTW